MIIEITEEQKYTIREALKVAKEMKEKSEVFAELSEILQPTHQTVNEFIVSTTTILTLETVLALLGIDLNE